MLFTDKQHSVIKLLFLFCTLFFIPFSLAQNTKPDESYSWNLKSVDILTVINQVAQRTGKSFSISPKVTGKVSFISSSPLTKDEVYQAFLALLQTNGFVAINQGPVTKIITTEYAREENSPVINHAILHASNEMAVTTIHIKYSPASEMVNALRQLVFHFGYIEAYKPANDIIISDNLNNISRIVTLVKQLDKPFSSRTEAIHLGHAQATELVTTLTSLLQQKEGEASNLTIAADERSNDILLHGATPEQRMQIRLLVQELDVTQDKKKFVTEVIYLKYLRAQKVAVILKSLIENLIQERQLVTGRKLGLPGAQQASTISTTPETSMASFSADSQQASQQLNNNANPYSQNQYSAVMGSTGPTNNTAVDFSSMVQKQPSSGSEGKYVQWEESTNAVVVSAPAEIMPRLKAVIAKLDIRRPQVLIEAVIAEVEDSRVRELGVELSLGGKVQFLTRFPTTLPVSGIGNNNNLAIINPFTVDATGKGLSLAYIAGNSLRFLLRALENDSRSNILSTPNILTLDNEPAQIKVGQKISFSIGQIQNNPTGGNPFNFFNQQDVGLILTLIPQITPDGSIKLIIQQELSNILPGQVSAGSNPNLSERFIHTTVMAKNGDVLVLGGLIQNEWQNNSSKVPVLGDIPGVGFFFRNDEKQLTKQNLMIFLRPTIIYDEEKSLHVVGSKYEFLRHQQLETEKEIAVSNNYQSPILPPWNKEVLLPSPFS